MKIGGNGVPFAKVQAILRSRVPWDTAFYRRGLDKWRHFMRCHADQVRRHLSRVKEASLLAREVNDRVPGTARAAHITSRWRMLVADEEYDGRNMILGLMISAPLPEPESEGESHG